MQHLVLLGPYSRRNVHAVASLLRARGLRVLRIAHVVVDDTVAQISGINASAVAAVLWATGGDTPVDANKLTYGFDIHVASGDAYTPLLKALRACRITDIALQSRL